MRILHIGKYYPPFAGGIENFMAALLPVQAASGDEVAVLVHQHRRGRPFGVEQMKQVRVYRVPIWGRLLFVPLSPWYARHLARVIGQFKPDILHIHMPNVSPFWVLFLKCCRDLPVVIHWHADVVASELHRGLALGYRFYRPFEQALLARSQAIIVTSPAYMKSSVALQSWQDKCHVVPLGLMPQASPDPVKLGLRAIKYWGNNTSSLRVLGVGRLSYYKGHEFLVRAVAGLADVQAIIVGSGDQYPRLQKLIEDVGAGEQFALYGAAPEAELQDLLQSCDCLCLPSIERTEAFGLVLLEAMRLGKAVIASDVPGAGMGWVVDHELNGLLVPPANVMALQNALLRLRDDPDLGIRLGQAGRQKFGQMFAIDRVADSIHRLYVDLPAGPASE
ncbi:MAG: glycosyltransferase [Pseudomonadales bacterium]|nr:glycosyltransferase [Pseudomonadales bacterium]